MLLSLAWSGFGFANAHLGDPETACKHIEKGLMIQNEAGIEWWSSLHYHLLSITYFMLDNLKSALGFIKKALELSQKNNEKMRPIHKVIGWTTLTTRILTLITSNLIQTT